MHEHDIDISRTVVTGRLLVQTPMVSPRSSSRAHSSRSRRTAVIESSLSSAPRFSKNSFKVSTNLESYDRKDPFLAFNSLLKLLGSLPYRLGGCQFRLTPEEHKLSLHLLNIVEPFVGLAPSRKTITRQPTEILDAIVFHIEDRSDLLSLALSCQRMHDIVFPRHYNYRVIRAKASSIRVWNHLTLNKSLARHVRTLEILDERSSTSEVVPPRILASDTDLESTDDELGLHAKQERFMLNALAKMTALTSFAWSSNHSPIGIDDLWPTLLQCGNLQEIRIKDNLMFAPPPDSDDDQPGASSTASLPAIRTVALSSTKHVYGSVKHPALTRVQGMLDRCPNLESLDIKYVSPGNQSAPPSIHDLLLLGRWPALNSLTLTNLKASAGFEAMSSFFNAHAHIEVLHLDCVGRQNLSSWHLPVNTLPQLRELRATRELTNFILSSPCDAPRPLEVISGVHLSTPRGQIDRVFVDNLRTHGKTLKRLYLAGWNEMDDLRQLVDAVPMLTMLDIGKRSIQSRLAHGERHSVAGPVNNALEWATLLSALPNLGTFHGVRFFYELSNAIVSLPPDCLTTADRSRVKRNEEVASLLAWKCTKLRRVDHWDEGSGKVIVLVRDREKDKVRWEVRRIKQ